MSKPSLSHERRRASPIGLWSLAVVTAIQAVCGLRVLRRLLRGFESKRIADAPLLEPVSGITVLVPVLNERDRLGPCLAGLSAQGPEVTEILVIDGGSTDGTQALVQEYATTDDRIRLLDASPVPADWNGKAWNLQAGYENATPANDWVQTIDADVRPEPALARAMVAMAQRERIPALSAATQQSLSGAAEAILHPAMLTTLVYRFGIPGRATSRVSEVQANGQAMLISRRALDEIGGFRVGQRSICEDVTVARKLSLCHHAVGFYETDDLVHVEMYRSAREAWRNWSRSLPMRDQFNQPGTAIGLAEVLFAQALPLPIAIALNILGTNTGAARAHDQMGSSHRWSWARSVLFAAQVTNTALVGIRLGTLVGTARAYRDRPLTYWLSPLADLPVAVKLIESSLRRTHTWRGRIVRRDEAAP